MPSIRIGFSTDFSLTSEQVGIGTTLPSARLDVAGQILSDNSSGSGGVSTVTRYDGFLGSEQRVTSNISIAQTTRGNLNSLSGEIVIEDEVTVTDDTPLTGGRLDSLTVTGKFDLPQGGTGDREDTPEKGSTRFNQDLGQLEFYTGYEWRTVNSYADSGGRGRGVFGGGQAPTFVSLIDYVNISTQGNAVSFGDMVASSGNNVRSGVAPVSSSTRGIFLGGGTPTRVNDCDYITIASEGNGIDFGNLTETSGFCMGASSSTRGLRMGGSTPANVNTIDYVEIATIGSALDFGDLTESTASGGAVSSPTRGIRAGGNPYTSIIDFVIISSKGDAKDFGDLIQSKDGSRGNVSSSVRGIFGGGRNSLSLSISIIDYITLASTGNAVFFGDLTTDRQGTGGASTQVRGVFAGGAEYTPSATVENTIDYITIASTGDAQDFGDMTVARQYSGGFSDSHGGLGGF